MAAGHILETKACVPGLLWTGFAELCVTDVPPAAFKSLAAKYSQWVVDDVPEPGSGPAAAWRRFAELLQELAKADAALFLVAREVPGWCEAAGAATDSEVREALLRVGGMLAGLPLMESDERLSVEGISGS